MSVINTINALGQTKINSGDSLYIPVNRLLEISVSISGAISSPGIYPWFEGITLQDLLSISGALDIQSRSYANYFQVELARWATNDSGFMPSKINLVDLIENSGGAQNIYLQPFDHVTVPRKKGYNLAEKVFINGQISHPGEYPLLNEKESLASLINRAGGMLPGAFEKGIVINRDSLYVGWPSKDILLAAGDSVYVPRQTGTVLVVGMVHNPGYYKWKKGKPVSYYLKLAGDLKAFSDKKSVVVTYPNGTSAPTSGWIKPPVSEGSIISANEGKERPSALNLVLDVFKRTTEPFVPIVSILVLMTATQR